MELLSGIMMFIQVAARPYSHQHEGMDSGDPDRETCRVYSLLFEYSLIGGYSVMPVHAGALPSKTCSPWPNPALHGLLSDGCVPIV
jgi:hypothetical protein